MKLQKGNCFELFGTGNVIEITDDKQSDYLVVCLKPDKQATTGIANVRFNRMDFIDSIDAGSLRAI